MFGKVTGVYAAITKAFLLKNEICAMFAMRRNKIPT
jgi:hypothetical protein